MKKILTKSLKNLSDLYPGCTQGTIYSINTNHDLIVKEDIDLLEKELAKKKTRFMVHSNIMSDCLPLENKQELINQTLNIFYNYAYGVSLLTKSNYILEEIDLIDKINQQKRVVVMTTLTTHDEELCKKLEPKCSTTKERFEMLKEFNKRNIDTVVCISPILPYINDSVENIRHILNYCKKAGVKAIITFGLVLSLKETNRDDFYNEVEKMFPKAISKYIDNFGNTCSISTKQNTILENIIFKFCLDNNIIYGNEEVFEFINQFPERTTLFDFEA